MVRKSVLHGKVHLAIKGKPYSPFQKRRQRWPSLGVGGLWLPSHQGSRLDWPQRQSSRRCSRRAVRLRPSGQSDRQSGNRSERPQRQRRHRSPGCSRRTSGRIGSGMGAARKRKRREKSAFSRLFLSMSEQANLRPLVPWNRSLNRLEQPSPALRAPSPAGGRGPSDGLRPAINPPRRGRCGTSASSRRLPATHPGARSSARRGIRVPGAAS